MRIQYLIIFLIIGIFIGEGQAMSPKKIDIPKGQPGHSALEEARARGGQGGSQKMSRQKALEYQEKFKKMYPHEYTKADIEILKEVHKVLGTEDKADDKSTYTCCQSNKCKSSPRGVCYNHTDPHTGKLKCSVGSQPCY